MPEEAILEAPETETPAAPEAPEAQDESQSPIQGNPELDSMFADLQSDLDKKAKEPEKQPEQQPDPKAQPEEGKKPDDAIKAEAEKPKKASPWKLVDEWKEKYRTLEKQVSESKTGLAEEERAKFTKQIEEIQKRNEEMEKEMRFIDYSKSAEFREKYEKPHEEAWQKAVAELSELTVEEGGVDRPFNEKDLLNIVNLPLGAARDLAEEKFGKFADDVMGHRKEIKRLFQSKVDAETKARNEGVERTIQQQETTTRQRAELEKTVGETWAKANEEITKDEVYGRFFTPDEADPETKTRLDKGFKIVDEAFRSNPMDPKLSASDRERIVQQQAAVRHRAAAFGRLVYMVKKAELEIASLKGELGNYKETEPSTTGGRKAPESVKSGDTMDSMLADLDKLVQR